MKNDMHENESSLVSLHYTPYINLIDEIVQKNSLFSISSSQVLQIAAANIAQQVAQEFRKREGTPRELSALFAYTLGTRSATVHLDGEQAVNEMGKAVEALRKTISTQLAETIQASTLPLGNPQTYVEGMPFSMASVQGKIPSGLHYPFLDPQKLNKRRIHLRSRNTRSTAASTRYRGHKLTIVLEGIEDFENDLIAGFSTLLQGQGATPAEIAEVHTFLEQSKQDPISELARLKKLIKEETLGKIKVEVCWWFWDEMVKAMEQASQHTPSASADEQVGMKEMRRQLRMLNRFRHVLQDPSWADTDFQVSYAGEEFNLRTLLARAEGYDVLPFGPEAVGTLGEVRNQVKDEQTFTYGLRFKLNGGVGSVDTAFQYYASLLNPFNPDHQERLTSPLWNHRYFAAEVIRVAVLYLVLFRLDDNDKFEPYLKAFLLRLSTDDPKAKEQLLSKLSKLLLQMQGASYRYEIPIEQARLALEAFLQQASVVPDIQPVSRYLILQNGMLRLNRNRMTLQKRFLQQDLFINEEHSKEALRYITVQDAIPQQDAFYALPVHLSIDPVYLSDDAMGNVEAAQMMYDIVDWKMLPVVFVPDTPTSRSVVDQTYARYRRVVIPYLERSPFPSESAETALYRHTFLLLTYLCLDVLWITIIPSLARQQKRLFFPLLRIHEQEQETGRYQSRFPNEGKVMRGMTKTLAHMLSCERGTLANAQGFRLVALQNKDQYRLSNGLSSLYNVLPRVITRPPTAPNTLDKLAIIIISSRVSDAHAASTFQRTCVYGEILGRTLLPDGKLRIEQLATFAVNEDSNNIYTTPHTLLDEVRRCSMAGFRHIFYVAKAPYTSHIHFTGKEESDELFFMSPDIIRGVLDAFPDVMLYPMFCDRYHTIKVNKKAATESLYVDDASELRTLMTDPSKSSVVFFNVMNGIHVPLDKHSKRHNYYHGVVSYATLINMYDNPLYDQAIRNNLLDGSQPGSLHPDLLDTLAYIHGVRYERREKNGVQLKLDPYESIIGVDSVGMRALMPSMDFRVRSNTLALLTLIRGMLRRKKTLQSATPPSTPPPIAPPSSESDDSQGGMSHAQ